VASGLVTRYTFDIDARDSIGSNNGTLTGGALVANDATRSNVLSLDGADDYVSLPSGSMTAGRSEVTLSLWINPDEWVFDNTIYDEDDSRDCVKQAMHELNVDPTTFRPQAVAAIISNAKNDMLSPEEFAKTAAGFAAEVAPEGASRA
jgi:hypothetical protein